MLKEKVVKTASGQPAIWEEGGGMTNTGYAYIVAGLQGEKITPIYIKKRGQLSCGQHALFLLRPGMHLVIVVRTKNQYQSEVLRFNGIEFCKCIDPNFMQDVIEIAKEKTRHYHCRQAYYFKPKEGEHEIEYLEKTSVNSISPKG